ncbi:unnamed protein product [Protopolystoma xenopodis]|uniref:Uncharacterized protein n=1 Tax=Protopolystoma xenopodis TaxID=117903 RepID=A0A3S5A768_9PLAT|nr:unnamed protein product [Protopolystoma xenopodis]
MQTQLLLYPDAIEVTRFERKSSRIKRDIVTAHLLTPCFVFPTVTLEFFSFARQLYKIQAFSYQPGDYALELRFLGALLVPLPSIEGPCSGLSRAPLTSDWPTESLAGPELQASFDTGRSVHGSSVLLSGQPAVLFHVLEPTEGFRFSRQGLIMPESPERRNTNLPEVWGPGLQDSWLMDDSEWSTTTTQGQMPNVTDGLREDCDNAEEKRNSGTRLQKFFCDTRGLHLGDILFTVRHEHIGKFESILFTWILSNAVE